MAHALRRPGLLLGALATSLLVAACGANGEGAPAESGCPVGGSASSCSSSDTGGNAAACNSSTQSGTDLFSEPVTISNKLPDGLQYGDITVGCGPAVKTGDKVSVMYTGWLSDGTQFDTSRQSGRGPFPLTLGQHQVITGWEEGIPGMHVGGKRRLVIPPALGYGPAGQPPTIPANATLVFDVEILSAG